MKIYVYVLLCIMLFSSCQEAERRKRIEEVGNWIGKKMECPVNGIFTCLGKDTISQFPKYPYVIVNYIDSTDCIGCKLRTLEWKKFMNKLEMKYPKMVSLLFYVQTKNIKELMWILKGDDFNYPVCVDKDGKFYKINQLPPDEVFRTFLLNADDEVLLVGSPVGNPSLEQLYMDEFEHHQD